VILFSNRRAR